LLLRVRRTEHAYTGTNTDSAYIVDRPWSTVVRDAQDRLLALSHHFYTGYGLDNPAGLAAPGDLVREAHYIDVPLQTSSVGVLLHGTDTTYGYDAYGNRTTVATYPQAGTRLVPASGPWQISAPGNGSAVRTTTTVYDSTFHTFPTHVTNPLGHEERANYDYRMGTLTVMDDANYQAITAEYDQFGRMLKLIRPGDSSAAPTIQASYYASSAGVTYLHSDHLGSISVTTTAYGAVLSQQEFDPWGKVRSGSMAQTARNYTGQFISADTVVPGSADGSMAGVALKALTVGFHEAGFAATLNQENRQPFWFQLSPEERQQVGSLWGPANPQALNRYSYVLNNPLRWTDPSGHSVYLTHQEAEQLIASYRDLANAMENYANNKGTISTILQALEVVLGYFAKALPAGVLATVATRLISDASADILLELAADLRKIADQVEKYNGDSGVIIGAACWSRLYTCEVSILDREQGNGVVLITKPGLFNKGFWNHLFLQSQHGYFEPGHACTLSGGHPTGSRWKQDQRACKPWS
jgi:hypothetical protein